MLRPSFRWCLGLGFLVLATIFTGCGPKPVGPLVGFVPDGATLLVALQPSAMANDPDLPRIYGEATSGAPQPAAFDTFLGQMKQDLGLDPRLVQEALIFSDLDRVGAAAGVIARGGWVKPDVVRHALARGGQPARAVDYRGTSLHVSATGHRALAFLSEEVVALGPPAVVRDIVDVATRRREALKGPMLERYRALSPGWLTVVALGGAELPRALASPSLLAWLPLNQATLERVAVAGVTMDKQGRDLQAVFSLTFADFGSAEEAVDRIEEDRSFVQALFATPSLTALLERLNVTRTGPSVTVRARTSVQEIQGIQRALRGAASR